MRDARRGNFIGEFSGIHRQYRILGSPGRTHPLVCFIEAHTLGVSSVILVLLVGGYSLFCALPAEWQEGVAVGILLLIAIPGMLGIIQTLLEDWVRDRKI